MGSLQDDSRRGGMESPRFLDEIPFAGEWLAASLDAFWIVSSEGQILDANPEFCRMTGYTQSELLRLRVQDIEPDAVPSNPYWHVLNIKSGESVRYETRQRTKQGRWMDVRVRARRIERHQDATIAFVRDVTESYKSAELLRESEDRIASICDNLVSGMVYQAYRVDEVNRKFTYVSEAVRRMYGVTPEQVLEDANLIYGRILPDDIGGITAAEEDHNVSKAVLSVEARVYNPDGTIRWSKWTSKPRLLADGTEVWDGIEVDVTEQKLAEQRLRQSRSLIQAVLDNLSIGIAVNSVDPTVEFTYMNDNFPRFYRTTREALAKPDSFWEAVYEDPDFRERIRKRVLEDCSTGDPNRMSWQEVPITRRGMETRYVNARNIPIKGQSAMISTVEDVTERKVALEGLKQFKTIFDTAGSGAAVTEMDGTIIYINESLAVAHGYEPSELVGRNLRSLHAPDQLELVEFLLERLVKEGGFAATEVWHRRANGTTFPMLMVGNLINDSTGQPRWMTATALDISDRKALEEQLQQAQKIESIGRLAGGVAHDFNNMLGVILGQTELAMERLDDPSYMRECLSEIRLAADRSARLTGQLLAFARQQTVTPQKLDLNATVEGALSMLRRLIGENIELSWIPNPSRACVNIDPIQVDQILANLCVNARDAIKGVGHISIETGVVSFDAAWCATHSDYLPGEYVWLAVTDDGCGIHPSVLQNLFEPFFTTKGIGEGTGLGLATVYGIVKQNEGFIHVSSEQGAGSTFRVYLPQCTCDGLVAEPPVPEAQVPTEGTETILLVEDEPAILQMTKVMLENQGYLVLAASLPREALALAREFTSGIDLLITDVVMPEMNGWELAARVADVHPDMKRLFMSGYTANIIARQGVLGEDVHFIQKPFSVRSLAEKVREILGEHVESPDR